MLKFILNNPIFEFVLCFLVLVNFILTIIIDWKQTRNDSNSLEKSNKFLKIKVITVASTFAIFLYFLYSQFSNFINLLIYFIIPFIILIKSICDMYSEKQCLSTDKKLLILWSAYIFVIFFSSSKLSIYYVFFSYYNHEIKEILLIGYLLTKIVLFIYYLFMNIAILISNISMLVPLKIKKEKAIKQYNIIKDYDFILYKKYGYKLLLILDLIIYILLCIPTVTLYLLFSFILKSISKLKLSLRYIISKMANFNNNYNRIIKKIINISIIVAFSIVYIIIILNKSIFVSQSIVDIYNFISTVILIPIVYDSIKSK